MTTLRQRVVALLTAATTALAITACSGGSTPTANGSIDVLSWWTSTSEGMPARSSPYAADGNPPAPP